LNWGDWANIIQIILIIASAGYYYAKFDANAVVTGIHTQQLDRIERYLSSKDPDYWIKSRKME
jgi:hypothetical protein